MAEEKLICTRCGDEITPGFEHGTEERPLCEECYCDMTAVCPVCGEFDDDDRKLKLFCSCNTEAPDQPGAFQLYDEYFGRADDLGIIPANNKQRKILFDKMLSEGYELKPCPDGRLVLAKIRNNNKED